MMLKEKMIQRSHQLKQEDAYITNSTDDQCNVTLHNQPYRARVVQRESINRSADAFIIVSSLSQLHGLDCSTPTQLFYYLAGILGVGSYAYQVTSTLKVIISDTIDINSRIHHYNSTTHVIVLELDPSQRLCNDNIIISNEPLTIIDVSKIGKINIIEPGIIDLQEISRLLPMPLLKGFQTSKIKPDFRIMTQSELNQNFFNEHSVIVAPKEIINSQVPKATPQFFQTLLYQNQEYINLGSINSCHTMLKNLYKIKPKIDNRISDITVPVTIIWVDSTLSFINESAYFVLTKLQEQYQSLVSIIIIKSWKI